MPFPLRFSGLATWSALLGCLVATACVAPAPVHEAAGNGPEACADPRPQVCTMIYAPVCAAHSDGRIETHASACNACADDTVLTYEDGPCEEGNTP
jgi:hypothetical protein